MDTMDTTAFEQQILKLGLVSEARLAEVRDELGPTSDLTHLIGILERKSYLTPWQRGKVLKGDSDGFFLGGYRILYKIASGSFGRVFRADDPRGGRVVAVKVLRRRWSEDQQRIDLFIREGKVGLTLKHPNIVEVLAINHDASSGQYYIVMEFVEGGNLREILQIRKKLNVAESLRIIEDAATGLAYAYSRGMTHRDIKLTNLLISSTGRGQAGGLRPGPVLRLLRQGRREGGSHRRLRRPGAGHRRQDRRRAQRHLFPRLRPVRDADRPVADCHDARQARAHAQGALRAGAADSARRGAVRRRCSRWWRR